MKYAKTEPPVLFAHTLYEVRVHSWVAVPYNVPFVLPKDIPVGRLVLFSSQETIEPGPKIPVSYTHLTLPTMLPV